MTDLNIYDVITHHLESIKTDLETVRAEQVEHGKSIATLKAQMCIVFTGGIIMFGAILKFWFEQAVK